MDFALDRKTGEKVLPLSAIRHRRYLCPCCKKEVTVRGVDIYSQRVPHFAHLKGRADKNCENFFESVSTYFNGPKFFNPIIPKNRELQLSTNIAEGFSKNLYLKVDGEDWKLYFQFQVKGIQQHWDGRIVILGFDGVKYFDSGKIIGRHEIRVDFNFSENSLSSNGYVDAELLEKICSDIPAITGEMNFFHAPYSTGRLLGKDDSMRVGEDYIIASRSSLIEINQIKEVIEEIKNINGINYFHLILPRSLTPEEKYAIEKFFGRNISEVRPIFKLLDPLPAFIEIDGTVHVPVGTALIALSFDCDESEIDYTMLGGVAGSDTAIINQNFLIINSADARGVEIYWHRSLMIRIEKIYTPPIEIEGIYINSEGLKYNLLESRILKQIPFNSLINLDSKWINLEKTVSIYKGLTSLGQVTESTIFKSENGVIINAGSFGYFEFLDSYILEVSTDAKETPAEPLNPQERWLRTLALLGNTGSIQKKSALYSINNSAALIQATNHLLQLKNIKDSKEVS